VGSAVSSPLAPPATPTTTADEPLRSEFLLDLVLDTQPPIPVGDRLIVGISGGTFQGPGLTGSVTGLFGDWIVRRPDGSSVLDVRVVFSTDDGEKIFVSWRGLAYTPEGGTLHARILPLFETGSARYRWLNNVVSVSVHRPMAGRVAYRVHRIL
jgi:Protein of unknown function (DUF3237)